LPELNEEFFKSLGVEEGGLDKLREDVADNLNRELEQNLRARVKQTVLERLLAVNPIDLPASLVDSQIQEMQVDAMRRAGNTDASQAPPREPFEEPARRRVALGLILNEIIKREQIAVDPARVTVRLSEMAGSYGDSEGLMKAYRQNANAMRQIENLVLEDQVVDSVLTQVKVREVSSSFKDVMQLP
jgi:trigger factor